MENKKPSIDLINERLQKIFKDKLPEIKNELEMKKGIIVGSLIEDLYAKEIDNLEMTVIFPRRTSDELKIIYYLHDLCKGSGRCCSDESQIWVYNSYKPQMKIIIIDYMGTYKQLISSESKYLYRIVNENEDIQPINYEK